MQSRTLAQGRERSIYSLGRVLQCVCVCARASACVGVRVCVCLLGYGSTTREPGRTGVPGVTTLQLRPSVVLPVPGLSLKGGNGAFSPLAKSYNMSVYVHVHLRVYECVCVCLSGYGSTTREPGRTGVPGVTTLQLRPSVVLPVPAQIKARNYYHHLHSFSSAQDSM